LEGGVWEKKGVSGRNNGNLEERALGGVFFFKI